MTQRQIQRYVALGDSLSEGVMDWGRGNRALGFAALLAGLLKQDSPTLEFTNLGVGGARVGDVLRGQLDRALTLKPDLVTLVVGANDVPTTAVEQFEREYVTLIERLRGGVPGLIAVATIPNFAHLLPPQYAGYGAALTQRVDGFNRIIQEAAARHDALLVDLQHSEAAQDPRNISSDGVHPNARGYRAMTGVFVAALNEVGFALNAPPLD